MVYATIEFPNKGKMWFMKSEGYEFEQEAPSFCVGISPHQMLS